MTSPSDEKWRPFFSVGSGSGLISTPVYTSWNTRTLFHLPSVTFTYTVIHEGSAALAAIQIRPEPGSMYYRQLLPCSYSQHLNSAQKIFSIDSKIRVATKLTNTLFYVGRIFKNKSSWKEVISDSCRIKSCPCIFHKGVLPDNAYGTFLYSITARKYQTFKLRVPYSVLASF